MDNVRAWLVRTQASMDGYHWHDVECIDPSTHRFIREVWELERSAPLPAPTTTFRYIATSAPEDT